jgi:anti-anti-sigma regulatory factor
MLGLLASLRDIVSKIRILNPSDDVREVLEITKLNQIFDVRDEVVP